MGSARPPTSAGSDVQQLAADLRVVIGRMARRLRQQAEKGVTASSLSALWSIERLGPVTLGDLAAAERVQPPTLTRIVARLEQAGLVSRKIDPSDRRVARIQLTSLGRRFVEGTRSRKTAHLAKALGSVAPEDRKVLGRAVRILEGMLGESR
jgi:DNA-binding MarR family transcriptional regulator